ncbi:hypothetical protein [Streptomyces sp. NPDC001978]|uniref:hypothetical protein n=1 Tax=Streptomyces sp. NPDC001978 TaxID=3364627 RepID=UPI0036BA110F
MEDPEWYQTDYSLSDIEWEPVEQWGGTTYGLGTVKRDGGHVAVVRTSERTEIYLGANRARAEACPSWVLTDHMVSPPPRKKSPRSRPS